MDSLPTFRFHPDPIATGSVERSSKTCVCCGRARGYVYVGPVYSNVEYDSCICPWCIADSSAHEKLHASFHDEASIGGVEWDDVPLASIEEITYRTPGFSGWQQERWWSHCGEAARFLGRAGCKELQEAGPQAIEAIRQSAGLPAGPDWDRFFNALDKEGSPTAYLFNCSKCGRFGGYQDCD